MALKRTHIHNQRGGFFTVALQAVPVLNPTTGQAIDQKSNFHMTQYQTRSTQKHSYRAKEEVRTCYCTVQSPSIDPP